MTNQRNTDNNRQSGQQAQPGQQSQQGHSDRNRQPGQQNQPGQQAQQDKPGKGFDKNSDGANKEKQGKVATSTPDSEKSDSKHL